MVVQPVKHQRWVELRKKEVMSPTHAGEFSEKCMEICNIVGKIHKALSTCENRSTATEQSLRKCVPWHEIRSNSWGGGLMSRGRAGGGGEPKVQS